jgi:hypothetical protein
VSSGCVPEYVSLVTDKTRQVLRTTSCLLVSHRRPPWHTDALPHRHLSRVTEAPGPWQLATQTPTLPSPRRFRDTGARFSPFFWPLLLLLFSSSPLLLFSSSPLLLFSSWRAPTPASADDAGIRRLYRSRGLLIECVLLQVYDDFVGHVAAARKLSAQQVEGGRESGGGGEIGHDGVYTSQRDTHTHTHTQVDAVARGRVWTGAQAYNLKLVGGCPLCL